MNHLIDVLQELVGDEGTVMIRTFSWTFCKGESFDIVNSLSQVGALGNCALCRKDFVRTRHPIYSWMVWGKFAGLLREYNNIDGFDGESIFQFLYDKKARQINLGNLTYTAMTMFHYAEIKVNVPYRRKKIFSAGYIDEHQRYSRREYTMYVRPLNIQVETAVFEGKETQNILRKLKIRTDINYNDKLTITTIDLYKAVNYIIKDFIENDGKHCIRIEGVNGVAAGGKDFNLAQY